MFHDYSFNICRIYGDINSLISDVGNLVKNPPANAGDTDLIPGFGKSPGVGNGNPLHYSCLDSSTDREAW